MSLCVELLLFCVVFCVGVAYQVFLFTVCCAWKSWCWVRCQSAVNIDDLDYKTVLHRCPLTGVGVDPKVFPCLCCSGIAR